MYIVLTIPDGVPINLSQGVPKKKCYYPNLFFIAIKALENNITSFSHDHQLREFVKEITSVIARAPFHITTYEQITSCLF